VTGATGLPLLVLLATAAEGDAQLLLLAEEPGGQPGNQPGTGDEVEVCRLPLAGEPIPAVVWLEGSTAWMLAGSVRGGAEGEPLHRTVALRRGGVRRAEAELHNLHGLADYGAGELDAARREFERAIAADGRFVDALYNAASVASLSDRHEEAVALLRRAAAEDPRRVQVLGRRDEDLRPLRSRSDVRALLGLQQAPQRGAEAPPDPP
jgi:tetratricopeptide (TPR) repeat protein